MCEGCARGLPDPEGQQDQDHQQEEEVGQQEGGRGAAEAHGAGESGQQLAIAMQKRTSKDNVKKINRKYIYSMEEIIYCAYTLYDWRAQKVCLKKQ